MTTQTSTRQIEPDITIMEVSGRLNLGNSLIGVEDAIKKLIKDGARKLILDLTGLSYTDSSGIGMIVVCSGEMNEAGGQVRIVGASGVVGRAFEVVRLSQVVPQDADIQTACKALSASGGGGS